MVHVVSLVFLFVDLWISNLYSQSWFVLLFESLFESLFAKMVLCPYCHRFFHRVMTHIDQSQCWKNPLPQLEGGYSSAGFGEDESVQEGDDDILYPLVVGDDDFSQDPIPDELTYYRSRPTTNSNVAIPSSVCNTNLLCFR